MKNLDSAKLFDSVVENAIDFLNRSVDELETLPKYSVINFWTSIELFFKARLLLEHWSLIFAETNSANPDTLVTGKFISTNIDITIERLKNLTGLILSSEASNTFNNLRKRRNQLIHFFHEDYLEAPSPELLSDIVSEQCRGWFYLHRFLTRDWKNEFINHHAEIETLHQHLRKQRGYLSAKFDSLKGSILRGIENGNKFRMCQSCQFIAQLFKKRVEPFYDFKCLVCDIEGAEIQIRCPECNDEIFEIDEGEGTCSSCYHYVDAEQMREIYNQKPPSNDYQGLSISCYSCDNDDIVILLDENKREFGCLACARIYDERNLHECLRCASTIACDDYEKIFGGCPSCYFS